MPQRPQPTGPQHRAATLAKRLGARVRNPEPRLDAAVDLQRLDALDLGEAFDDPLAQREARREILDVRRARHHHRLGGAVHGDGDRRLLGQRAGDLPAARRP